LHQPSASSAAVACFWPVRVDSGQKVGKGLAKVLSLDPLTTSLRGRGIKGSLVIVNDRLFWRCILLGLPANPGHLIEAESRVVSLAAEIGRSGILPDPLPWAGDREESKGRQGKVSRAGQALTVSEAFERLKSDFWQGKVRTSAAERTWSRVTDEMK